MLTAEIENPSRVVSRPVEAGPSSSEVCIEDPQWGCSAQSPWMLPSQDSKSDVQSRSRGGDFCKDFQFLPEPVPVACVPYCRSSRLCDTLGLPNTANARFSVQKTSSGIVFCSLVSYLLQPSVSLWYAVCTKKNYENLLLRFYIFLPNNGNTSRVFRIRSVKHIDLSFASIVKMTDVQ